MASTQQVRQYLAYWFQLGKGVVLGNQTVLPRPVIAGDRFSPEFEACWHQLQTGNANTAYLEGTRETIGELLSDAWDISACARCAMPVPAKVLGVASLECPCIDLPNWPNTEVPQPRDPVSSQDRLSNIRDRLQKSS